MSLFSNLLGVMGVLFRLGGPLGPNLKRNGTAIELRDNLDAAFVNGRGADPILDDDFVTKRFFDNGMVLAKGILAYPQNGSPLDSVLYTLPNKTLIQYVVFRPETPLVGAGNITLRAGTTVGGNEILVDQVITAATPSGPALGTVYGFDIGELGLSMAGQLGYALLGNAGTVIRSRMTRAGAVTGGTIKYWVAGFDLG